MPRADAFVIWIDRQRPGAAPAREALEGRVEHVRTSERAAFSCAEELLRFIETQLAAPGDPESKLEDDARGKP